MQKRRVSVLVNLLRYSLWESRKETWKELASGSVFLPGKMPNAINSGLCPHCFKEACLPGRLQPFPDAFTLVLLHLTVSRTTNHLGHWSAALLPASFTGALVASACGVSSPAASAVQACVRGGAGQNSRSFQHHSADTGHGAQAVSRVLYWESFVLKEKEQVFVGGGITSSSSWGGNAFRAKEGLRP